MRIWGKIREVLRYTTPLYKERERGCSYLMGDLSMETSDRVVKPDVAASVRLPHTHAGGNGRAPLVGTRRATMTDVGGLPRMPGCGH